MPVSAALEAFFLDAGIGPDDRRFCLYHPPSAPVRAAMVYVHPFAEEMNKSRRMAAVQARAFAAAGIGVLQIDLAGCGDSGGELVNATWQGWLHDIQHGVNWLQARLPGLPLWLWGLRAGCLLASEVARQQEGPTHLLLWQPPASGKPLLQQFLRLRMAAQLADSGGGGSKGLTESLRADLAAGRSVDVGGYELPAAVALGLEQAVLHPPTSGQRLSWLEVSPREPAELLPASNLLLQRWNAGPQVQALAVTGPSFWQTTEIEDAPALVAASLRVLFS